MSKLLPTISGVACFLWVSGWTWIFSEGKPDSTSSSNPTPINLLIDSLQYHVQHPFSFEYSEAMPIITENFHPVLKSLTQRLVKQPKIKLSIIGVYGPIEQNETTFPNLGLARAEGIKSLLVSSGASSEQIETMGMPFDNLFEVEGMLTGIIYFKFNKESLDSQGVVKANPYESGNISIIGVTSFYYKYGDYKIEKQHLPFLKTLQYELQKDANKSVELTGYSAPEEEAASSRIDLAEIRAMSVRRYLVDNGVRRAQILVKAKPGMAKSSSEMTVTIQVVEK